MKDTYTVVVYGVSKLRAWPIAVFMTRMLLYLYASMEHMSRARVCPASVVLKLLTVLIVAEHTDVKLKKLAMQRIEPLWLLSGTQVDFYLISVLLFNPVNLKI